MKKINLDICIGTACFVMGANKLQDIGDYLPDDWKELVEIKAQNCLNLCHNNEYSKAPYVKIDEEIISEATVEKILSIIKEKIQNSRVK